VRAYVEAFPANQRFAGPSLSATSYYNSFNALKQALEQVNGDLANNHAALRQALASLTLQAPNGDIRLDGNRQAIGTNFINVVVEGPNDSLLSRMTRVVPNVTQTLGRSPEEFARIGLPSRTNPECRAR
jgi:hypothetical protein